MKEHGRLICMKDSLTAITPKKQLNRKTAAMFYLKDISVLRSNENFEPSELEERPVTQEEIKSVLNGRASQGIFSHPARYASGENSIAS